MSRPEPRDGFPSDVATAYEEGFNAVFMSLANTELQEIANEERYEENAFGQDGDYSGYSLFLMAVQGIQHPC